MTDDKQPDIGAVYEAKVGQEAHPGTRRVVAIVPFTRKGEAPRIYVDFIPINKAGDDQPKRRVPLADWNAWQGKCIKAAPAAAGEA